MFHVLYVNSLYLVYFIEPAEYFARAVAPSPITDRNPITDRKRTGSVTAKLRFTLKDFYRFGACLSLKYRMKTKNNGTAYFRVVGFGKGGGGYMSLGYVRDKPEGNVWISQEFSIPPLAFKWPFVVNLH